MDARRLLAQALLVVVTLAAGPAGAAGGPGLTDHAGDVLRRVVQTVVAIAVLVVMARPAAEDGEAAAARPAGTRADGGPASRSMRSGVIASSSTRHVA